MKTKRLIVIAVLVTGGLLVCLAAALLFRGLLRLRREHEDLDRAKRKLSGIYERNPFPSPENIEVERASTATLQQWYAELHDALRARNIVSHEDSPSLFIRNFEATTATLRNLANQHRVTLTAGPDFPFGFDRYSGTGVLPPREHVAVLSEQLLIIEQLCRILFESGIVSLSSVRRDPVDREDGAGASPRGPSAPPPAGGRSQRPGAPMGPAAAPAARTVGVVVGEHYSTMHFRLEFTAGEVALIEALNRFSSGRVFVAVESIAFSKEMRELVPEIAVTPSPRPAAAEDLFFSRPEAVPAAPELPAVTPIWKRPKDQRIVSGPGNETPMQVAIELSVYKFKGE